LDEQPAHVAASAFALAGVESDLGDPFPGMLEAPQVGEVAGQQFAAFTGARVGLPHARSVALKIHQNDAGAAILSLSA
jgi:hypothetical protein